MFLASERPCEGALAVHDLCGEPQKTLVPKAAWTRSRGNSSVGPFKLGDMKIWRKFQGFTHHSNLFRHYSRRCLFFLRFCDNVDDEFYGGVVLSRRGER